MVEVRRVGRWERGTNLIGVSRCVNVDGVG